MYYLVNVYHTSMATHLTRSDCVEIQKCCIFNAVDGSDMLWNGSEEDGDVKTVCEEDEGTDCEDEDSDNEW